MFIWEKDSKVKRKNPTIYFRCNFDGDEDQLFHHLFPFVLLGFDATITEKTKSGQVLFRNNHNHFSVRDSNGKAIVQGVRDAKMSTEIKKQIMTALQVNGSPPKIAEIIPGINVVDVLNVKQRERVFFQRRMTNTTQTLRQSTWRMRSKRKNIGSCKEFEPQRFQEKPYSTLNFIECSTTQLAKQVLLNFEKNKKNAIFFRVAY